MHRRLRVDGTGRKEHEARSCGCITGPRTRGPDDINVQGCGADNQRCLAVAIYKMGT